jgi:ABC-type amino acid transport substrate-binding protein
MKQLIKRQFGTFLSSDTTAVSEVRSPTVLDLTILVLGIVISVFAISLAYDTGLQSQITDSESQLLKLREEDATVQVKLVEESATKKLSEAEHDVPHPTLKDREIQAIGDHVDVSWENPDRIPGRYVSYAIELTNVAGGNACPSEAGPTCVFLASDSRHSTSRIPSNGTLDPGRYVWRVAAVPAGASLSTEETTWGQSLISDWSAYASFTVYASQADRIWITQEIRVGLDLGQRTAFAQRASDGTILGAEISLIYSLVEGCLRFNADKRLHYDKDACGQFLTNNNHYLELTSSNHKCAVGEGHPCVTFVPIDRWGSYPMAVKRKEIDLFVGTATRAAEREGGGLRFTRGYYPVTTTLYGRPEIGQARQENLARWLDHARTIGVIANSTNEYVLDKLIAARIRAKTQFSPRKVEFDSFPLVETAMDKGEIDGVIVDDVFVTQTHWRVIPGLAQTPEYRESYLRDFVKAKREEYAIAVSVDDEDQSLYVEVDNALKDGLLTRDGLSLFATP